jgi:hypothetical protein
MGDSPGDENATQPMTTNLCHIFCDAFLFWILQAVIVLFALFAALRNWIAARKAGRGGATMQIKRGETSMRYFYGAYAAINGLLVAICLSVDAPVVKNHRIFLAVVDTAAVAYVCIFNGWFRNHFLRFAFRFVDYLSKLEER